MKKNVIILVVILFLIFIASGFVLLFSKNTKVLNSLNIKIKTKAGSCLVVEDKNCGKIKIIEYQGYKMAVANLPKDSSIFSPISGSYNNSLAFIPDGGEKDIGAIINSSTPGDINNIIYTFIYSKESERKIIDNDSIKIGDEIGKIDNFKLKNFKDYNFVFYISERESAGNNAKYISRDNDLLKMFK